MILTKEAKTFMESLIEGVQEYSNDPTKANWQSIRQIFFNKDILPKGIVRKTRNTPLYDSYGDTTSYGLIVELVLGGSKDDDSDECLFVELTAFPKSFYPSGYNDCEQLLFKSWLMNEYNCTDTETGKKWKQSFQDYYETLVFAEEQREYGIIIEEITEEQANELVLANKECSYDDGGHFFRTENYFYRIRDPKNLIEIVSRLDEEWKFSW